ncbi:hypothetical protein EV356DRAFT_483884 [Viridothelium virens]|uniref:DNA ligase D 3'-phosphoesterase domain-containing protein n=1 Tax=Viridothelium virens TaxID=1048519 RepID=A0A6A6HBT9_VIRVR|nr:hypothetical protein EV356DRAFT_483884 [Viridothelium virens]
MAPLASLKRSVSPPPTNRYSNEIAVPSENEARHEVEPSLAAVEAGKAQVDNHLAYFSIRLSRASRLTAAPTPRLSLHQFAELYHRNESADGHHFVIHQHDHPVAGVHYDLRLQFSESSSISFAVPYGMPGDPNSRRQLRMAIETRVHNLWNHLIESASHATGSLLIWDIGEYEVLPKQSKPVVETDDELSAEEGASGTDSASRPEPVKLAEAFQVRRIHLRLHGTKLPHNYTLNLRLPTSNDHPAKHPTPARRKRRRKTPSSTKTPVDSTTSDSGDARDARDEAIASRAGHASDDDESRDTAEDRTIRATNTYPGATNSIGSVHQRRWVLTLDREASGFERVRKGVERGRWVRRWEAFYVRGREEERSVVTGRLAGELMQDEGVEGYAGRKMWMPILG